MSSYEDKIVKILQKEKIKFLREKTFKDLRNGLFRYDFFINYKGQEMIIEVDGEYHFLPIRGRGPLLKQKENDRRKNSYCLAHEIPLYRIPFWELKNVKSFGDILQKKFKVESSWHNDSLEVVK